MTYRVIVGVVLAFAVIRGATAHGAAVLIPDHTFRLGSCGGADGTGCTWQCGVGKSCADGGPCELRAKSPFAAALVASADTLACGAQTGVVLRFGLAGVPGPTPFDTFIDTCGLDTSCTGREPRDCGVCKDKTLSPLCTSEFPGGSGEYPCPPGDKMFFCKDPCADSASDVFSEADLDSLGIWFRETRQPFPAFMRAQLQSNLPGAPVVGRPVFYFAHELDFPVSHLCVRFFFTTQEKPLGTCAGDARRFCAGDQDCPSGDACLPGGPSAKFDLATRNDVVSDSRCASGSRAGRPCGSASDCGGATCAPPLAPSASAKFCDQSFTPCTTSCSGGETCVSCPSPACGDGIVDPGEECDDANTSNGDGCDASCHVESCWTCAGVLGQQSACTPARAGALCAQDATPCTEQCNGFGACVAVGEPSGCTAEAAGKAQLSFKNVDPAKATLKWKWVGALDATTLGDPSTSDALSLCVFDGNGFEFGATAPAGGTCGTKPCWVVGDGKIKYKNKDATPGGLTKLQAKSGAAGKGSLLLQGKGPNLVLPTAALALPVRAYMVTEAGPACLQATYSNAGTNAPGEFKAK